MLTLLQIDFPFEGPFGEDMHHAMQDLAQSISQEPGLIWKLWTENPATQEAGGVYLFSDAQSAQNYLTMHEARLSASGVKGIRAKLFSVNTPLSKICNGPIQ
ncbi:MAG: monooxygenase [Gammaproteobacteria bacterium]|nr:monooxygenase [Gammaproteobacteria bacterium]